MGRVRKLGKERIFDLQAALGAGEGKRGPVYEVGLDSCFSKNPKSVELLYKAPPAWECSRADQEMREQSKLRQRQA